MACKIIYKGKALPEEEAKIEINNDVVDDLNEQAVGKSIINSALLTDEEINQQITDLNKFKTVIENNYFKLEDNISVSSLVINKHIKNAPASLGKVKIDSKWRTKEEAKKQVEENLKQRKLFSKLKRNFGITEEQLNLIENVSADKAISSAEDLINAIESKLLSLNSLVLNSKKSKSATLQQKQQAISKYSQYLSQNPNGSVEEFKSWVDNNQTNVQYQKQIDLQAEQDAVLEEIANSLSERFNISFDLISEEEAKSMFSKYNNEPAFFDPKTKKAYLVKGKSNKTSAIHEIFTHPLLLQIEKTNPTLYKNLLKEAKNNKSVVDYVDNLYGTNQNNDHEYIARAIDLAVQGELDQQKDKTLLGRIQDFFNQLSDYLKKLFNVPKVFSSAISPNITLQQLTQFAMYGKGKMNLNPAQENIEYSLKATNVILKNLDKIKQWEKNKSISEDVLWNKIQELGVPKEQLELIKNSEGNTVEEKLLDFTNQYSFAVEINTAKTNINSGGAAVQELDDLYIPQLRETFYFSYRDGWFKEDSKQDRIIATPEELKIIEEYKNKDATRNSSFYLSLSVPGDTEWKNKYENNPDWEYQELEFHTPDITLSIKGHALFSTDNGIGWVRVWYNKKTGAVEIQEIQSDLFQKGRDSKLLTGEYSKFPIGAKVKYKNNIYTIDNKYDGDIFKLYDLKNEDGIIRGIKANEFTDIVESAGSNQFLQLLNKNNNWVTFFVKSIIQDSAKKGYEKVLFPTGNTASKVEGHTTLEEFKKQKEDRIKDLEIRISKFNKAINNPTDFYDKETQGYLIRGMGLTHFDEESFIEIVKEKKEKYGNEVTQIKQELERIETEGFSALKPIYNFYENTVTNILNKTYGKVQDYSNIPIKNGVDFLFEENKELTKIGSKQLYSAYLDTIFPDSKMKDIYLHQTNNDFKNTGFDKTKIGSNTNNDGYFGYGFYFVKDTGTPINGGWGGFASAPIAYGEIEMPVILNIKKIKNGITTIQKDPKKLTDELKREGYDSINAPDGLVVFEPEQIHILGSKQDIESFKKFVKESSKPKVSQITDEYGNTWNELTIDENRDNQNIAFQKTPQANSFSQYLESLNKPNTNPILQGNQTNIEEIITQLEKEGLLEIDCKGKLKAEKGLVTSFTKGSQWEIAKDLKGYPSHAQGGVDIKLGKDGFSFTGKDGIIKAKYGLVLPVIKAQSGVVVNNDDKNKSKYRPSIGDKVGDNYITDNNIVNKFKRYLTESSITDNPSEFLKNVASKKNPFGYYGGLPFSTAAKAGKWKIDRNDKEGYYSLYNYNPFGDSFYDRVYDKDIKKYDYDENTKKEIQKHYKSGAIKPVIDYEKNELGWEYNDYSKLQDKTIKDKKFVQDWFNNPEAKKRYIKSGGTEEQWKENIDNINKNLSTLKIKETLKIPDLYIGENALYSPYYHSVLDNFGNAYTHEITHGSHAAKNKHSSSIIKDVVKNHSLRKDSYYQSDEEVYSRIMQIRKDFDIKPSDKIDKEYLKQKLLEQKSKYKDVDELFRYIDSKGIIKLLNSLADNSNKSTNNNLV